MQIYGNSVITGTLDLQGNLSDSNSDLTIADNAIPSANNTYTLGTSAANWLRLYSTNVSSTHIDALHYVSSTKFQVSAAGSAAAPSIALAGGSNTGIYGSAGGGGFLSFDGANKLDWGSNVSVYTNFLPTATALMI